MPSVYFLEAALKVLIVYDYFKVQHFIMIPKSYVMEN